MSKQRTARSRSLGPTPTEFVYLRTVAANMQTARRLRNAYSNSSRKREFGTAAQRKNIITGGTKDAAICMPHNFTTYIVRHHTESRATLVQFFDAVFCSLHLPCVHGDNELSELQGIFRIFTRLLTQWRKARRPWKHLVFGPDLNVQLASNVESITPILNSIHSMHPSQF